MFDTVTLREAKSPFASRATIVEAPLADAAVVAELGIFVNDAPEPENKEAVTTLAAIDALASLATIFDAVDAVVASTAHVVAVPPLKLDPVRYVPLVSVCGVLAVTVIFALPLNDTPLIVLAFCNVVAVVALPESDAVTTLALNEPSTSRTTIVEAPLADAAVVLALEIVPLATFDAFKFVS